MLQEVWSDGTPATQMRTEIQILDANGKATPGRYVVTWASHSRWSEELEIANYKRLRVHNSMGYWQKSTLDFQPLVVFQLDSLLDFKTVLNVGAKEFLGKVRSQKKDGLHQNCTDIKSPTRTERTLCFHEATGNLLSVEYPQSENQNRGEISRVEYGAFNDYGDKRIPFEVRGFRDGTLVLTAKISELKTATEDNSALFAAPANSEFWRQCDDVQGAELLNHVPPMYPPNARFAGDEGRVTFYAVIEADGTLSRLRLIQRATPMLESAAASAVRQRRYKPATCGTTPIRVETSISTDFWLQH